MSERISQTFRRMKAEGRKVLVGYLTAGDPSLEQSMKDVLSALNAGVDVLELGVPFSDPTADGPTIQLASKRALEGGMDLPRVLGMVRGIRQESEAPIILFGYANPFLRYGYERLCADAAAAGADGFLVVDLPFEESAELRVHSDRSGLALVSLVAPTTAPERAAAILAGARGFVYYITLRGVTGTRSTVAPDIGRHVAALRACTKLPIAVGFGVSDGVQAHGAAASADGVVVGSALVKAASEQRLESFVGELRRSLDAR